MLPPLPSLAYAVGGLAIDLPPTPKGEAAEWVLGALLAVLVPVGIAFARGWVVIGSTHKEVVADLKAQRDAADARTKLANDNAARAADVLERTLATFERLAVDRPPRPRAKKASDDR